MSVRARVRARVPRAVALAAASIALAGCRCNRDHPYVPYAIEDTGTTAAIDAGAASTEPEIDAGPYHAREAAVAPPNATRMSVDGLDLAAPPDRVFALALSGDFDGDGTNDAAALVIAPPSPFDDGGNLDTGDLLLYRGLAGGGLGAPQEIATPPQLPSDASCVAKRRLAQVGRHSLVIETGSACDHHAASRWLGVIAIDREGAKLHFRATLLDPLDAAPLAIDVDGADRDGDGLDDVTLRASIEGGAPPFEPGPRVSTLLRWFDRPAGMSRDPEEPDASLRSVGSSALARAAKAKDAPAVPRLVEQLRVLYRAVCAEGGSPRVVDLLGGARAVPCGSSKGLEEAGLAEVRAYATTGDPLRAIAALDRAQTAPATRTASRTTEALGWIEKAAPVAAPVAPLRVVAAVPQIERGASPAWGALAFEPSGKLLVRTVAGVVRVDPATGEEAAADDVKAWSGGVVAPDGAARWVDAYDSCDGRALIAAFSAANETRDVALPIAPPLAKCTGARTSAAAIPVAWGPRGLEAIVAGEPVAIAPDLSRALPSFVPTDAPFTPGAPRSPGGKVVVVPTSQGLFVRGARARLLRAPELQGGWLELRDCAVADDAAHVACVRGGRAFVGAWPAE